MSLPMSLSNLKIGFYVRVYVHAHIYVFIYAFVYAYALSDEATLCRDIIPL